MVFHRIINERIEKSIKGRRIGHTGERGRGLLCISTMVVMSAGMVLPGAPSDHLHSTRPAREESGVHLLSAKKFFIAVMLL